jgi:hypothetical protein
LRCDDTNGVQVLLGKVLILNHALWQPLPWIEGKLEATSFKRLGMI